MLRTFIAMVAASFLGIASYVYFGSEDQDSFNDRGLLADTISPQDNGFEHLRFSQDDNFTAFSREENHKLHKHLEGKIWDAKWVSELLTEKQALIKATQLASKAQGFDLQPDFELKSHHKSAHDINYMPLTDLANLIRLQFLFAEKQADSQHALEATRTLLDYGQQLKTQSNITLLSYSVGQTIEEMGLNQIGKLIAAGALNRADAQDLLTLLIINSKAPNEDFANVFKGEFKFGLNLVNGFYTQPLSERWANHFKQRHHYQQLSLSEELAELLFLTLPDFYLHRNTEIDNLAKFYSGLIKNYQAGCTKFNPASENETNTDFTLSDLLKPNSHGLEMRNGLSESTFDEYQLRHCLHQSYVQASKVKLAARLFRLHYGRDISNIEELSELVSMTELQDPFTGDHLRLSETAKEIYSLGLDRKEELKSQRSPYQRFCYQNAGCYNAPSFSLN